MKIIFDYNRTIFDPDTDCLYEGILELLQKISRKHELFLISRNEPTRKKRLEELNVNKYFQKITFVDNKSKEVFEKIIGNTKNAVVIGDSINDEIKIGNQLGLFTVRLKKGKFAETVPQSKDEIAKFETTYIADLEEIITKIDLHTN
jgi:FMN phosphatase YigB (HAD superfamily)